MSHRDSPARRITDLFAVLIAVGGFAISYTTQAVLAGDHGFPGWEAWLWPGIADAAALAMMLRLHFGQVRRGWYTVEAWLVFAVASGIMVGANAIADRNDPLGGWMHAMVPVVAMLVWHVIIHGAPRATGETAAETVKVTVPKPASKPTRVRVAAGAAVRIAEHFAAIRNAGGDPSRLSLREIEKATGVPRATVARHLPRVRGEAAA